MLTCDAHPTACDTHSLALPLSAVDRTPLYYTLNISVSNPQTDGTPTLVDVALIEEMPAQGTSLPAFNVSCAHAV